MEGSVFEAQATSLTSSATSDSETSSLVDTWTIVDKDEAEHVRRSFFSLVSMMIDKKAPLKRKIIIWVPFLGDQ